MKWLIINWLSQLWNTFGKSERVSRRWTEIFLRNGQVFQVIFWYFYLDLMKSQSWMIYARICASKFFWSPWNSPQHLFRSGLEVCMIFKSTSWSSINEHHSRLLVNQSPSFIPISLPSISDSLWCKLWNRCSFSEYQLCYRYRNNLRSRSFFSKEIFNLFWSCRNVIIQQHRNFYRNTIGLIKPMRMNENLGKIFDGNSHWRIPLFV